MTLQVPMVFDPIAQKRNRARAANAFHKYSFLKEEAVKRIVDRIDIIRRDFELCLDIGAHDGQLFDRLRSLNKIRKLIQSDPVEAFKISKKQPFVVHNFNILPFKESSFDAIFSSLNFHAVDDLPGLMSQIRFLLKPDGLCLVNFFGGNSLFELRAALAEAESEIVGGSNIRCMPMADIRDVGALIGRAGLSLPVADSDRLTVSYPNMFSLMADLRGMGEQNATLGRTRRPTRRSIFLLAAEIYQKRFSLPNGKIPASFEIITLTGWAPHKSQQKPLRPGEGDKNMADFLDENNS